MLAYFTNNDFKGPAEAKAMINSFAVVCNNNQLITKYNRFVLEVPFLALKRNSTNPKWIN